MKLEKQIKKILIDGMFTITAAETAPSPKNETKSGVRYCKTIGNIMLVSSVVKGYGPS